MNLIDKKYLSIILSFILLSCNMKTYLLEDKVTKVPFDSIAYNNRSKFTFSLLSIVDTNIVYEEVDMRYNTLARLDNHRDNSVYGIYKFYQNGRLNYFLINRDRLLNPNNFNPENSGYRGIYYSEKNKIKYDLFVISSELGEIDKQTGTFSFSADTLYSNRKNAKGINATNYATKVYVKRKLLPEYFQFKANW